MALGGFRAVPEVAEMLVSGEIEDSDVDSVWAGAAGEQAVGSKAQAMLSVSPGGLLDADGVVVGADAEQFVKAWRALEAMFEYDNIDDEYKDRFGEDGDRMLGGAEAAANAKLEWTIVEDAELSAAAVKDGESSAAESASEGSASADTSTACLQKSVLSGACLSSWEEVASNGRGAVGGTVLKNEVLACAFLAEPLADGDLTAAEVDELWSRHVGESEEAADEASFGKFWGAIEDLFEDEGAGDEGLGSTPKTTTPSSPSSSSSSPSSYEAIRSELVAIMEELPRAGLGCGEKTQRRMAELCDELDEHPTQVAMRATVTPGDLRLEGSWELAYTSSASFNFNQGFTGVAKTTPGGATFESLTQVLRATRIGGGGEGSLDLAVVGDTSFVETLSLGGQSGGANGEDSDGGLAQGPAGAAGFLGGIGAMFGQGQDNKAGQGETSRRRGRRGGPGGLSLPKLVVDVDGSWELKRRLDLMSTSDLESVVLDVTAQALRYGPVEVRGKRVEVGWKSMRVLNGANLRCLEPTGPVRSRSDKGGASPSGESPSKGDLRIMHGSAGKSSLFIFRRT